MRQSNTRNIWTTVCLLGAILGGAADIASAQDSVKPKRAVLFIIDGLHWQAPDRLEMKNLKQLAEQGTYFRRAHLLPPYHPTTGDWARLHTCSIPNPVMLAGTLFVRSKQKLIQDSFFPST